MDKLAGQYKDEVIFILVNTRGTEAAKEYVRQNNLSAQALIHAAGRPPREYQLRYIPHKTLIDKSGLVYKNFEGVNLSQDVPHLV
mmetsp:Transcript_23090/g.41722  ORF Transcript_23090/g.41722 Transcript_23090/m.41722 type:complete len:85 (-) Transcript_23090:86-340(-)|eukprot:CAMPEP_0197672940 /NCGR_PEP_ID=MMETSP1338-20131121/80006_1 /TAXON_ID=43686 ORGANISM="Pelagodinium beii, Strain RCC1491" /NCGR_SAMPLE_ID=MMETSP1338 /ASSEMBLY_ACC=CAM_ASM_000754 /LENGTH=84 /DNA_ID=CAMNT_0043253123 /DNA_START=72 /DNA_END=326 /DNA_ORIENTATION=-